MAESLVMGGERVEAADGATLEVIEPAAGDAMGRSPRRGPRTPRALSTSPSGRSRTVRGHA